MNILKKNCVKRALRTFFQTAVGYLAVNVAVVDFSADKALKNGLLQMILTYCLRKNNFYKGHANIIHLT